MTLWTGAPPRSPGACFVEASSNGSYDAAWLVRVCKHECYCCCYCYCYCYCYSTATATATAAAASAAATAAATATAPATAATAHYYNHHDLDD